MRSVPACRLLGAVVAAVLLSTEGAPPATASPIVAAAGDIACDPTSPDFHGGAGDATHCRQEATAALLVGAEAVLPLGDVQYHEGSLTKFQQSYDPSWGQAKAVTRPVIGNHEFYEGSGSPLGSGFFDYFNGSGVSTGPAGDRSKGYYSFSVGDWRLIALNTNCAHVGGCGRGSPQEQWLRAELSTAPTACTLAYAHHPRFSSGGIGNHEALEALWQALYDGGADVVLAGHDHNYERFAPQNPAGGADPTYGLREFVVGTGGKSLLAMGTTKPNSQVRDNTAFGVLKLTLHSGGYDWRFQPVDAGRFSDSGSQSCHGKPPPARPTAETGAAAGITSTAATLTGFVRPKYQPTTYRFQYGRTTSYGRSTPERSLSETDGARHLVSARIGSLASGVTYHYRLVANNASGTVYGANQSFVTGSSGRYPRAVLNTPSLLSYWRLGDRSGSTALDQLAARAGTYRGVFALGRPDALANDSDTAVTFDGSSGEMTTEGPALSTYGSIEGWYDWRSGTTLLRDHSTYSGGGWIMAYDSGGYVKYRVAGKTFSTGRTTASLRNGWHHLVLTKNAGSVALYIDGQLVSSGTGASNIAAVTPWHLMRNGAYSAFSAGTADELAIYSQPLSATTVKQHYDAAKGL